MCPGSSEDRFLGDEVSFPKGGSMSKNKYNNGVLPNLLMCDLLHESHREQKAVNLDLPS